MTLALGPVGLWTFSLDRQPVPAAQETASRLEELGYAAIWVPEATNRNGFVNAAMLLSGTSHITVATGIAPINARDPMATANGQRTIESWFPGRFLLGLGVSHAWLVEEVRGGVYGPPLESMRRYLDAIDAAPFSADGPTERLPRVIAALGPKMLAVARDHADGAHPYLTTVEHTAGAREILGPGKLLCPDMKCVLDTDAARAREIGRFHLANYLGQPNYRNSFLRQGFTPDDVDHGGSDRLVDAIVAHGDVEAIADRVTAHLDAGADHVAVQVLPPTMEYLPLAEWERLAPALLA
ncbi:MAG: LLM class F420-dependent oxidoreductase [Acidimicrobiales bacterium]|nr:LLM class F420-dependent oxidoreductase [Acidimicrobiales bacterium]